MSALLIATLFLIALTKGIGPSCDEVVQTVAEADKKTSIITPPPLAGTWVSDSMVWLCPPVEDSGSSRVVCCSGEDGVVWRKPNRYPFLTGDNLASPDGGLPRVLCHTLSHRCETRPGPEYILRWHWYSDNGTYSHNTFFYLDDGCARPLWSRCVKGTYVHRGKSWLMQGSSQLEFFLQEVMIILYSTTMALDMFNRANASCPGVVMGRWTPDVQYVVYKHTEKNATTATQDELDKERICMDFLQLSLKETTLTRVQRRPPTSYDVWGEREELLLGEPRSKLTLFYEPLLRANQTLECVPCQQVHKSTLLYPPKLKLKPPLQIHLSGEWISTRCEIKHNALFLRRRLKVSGQSWHAEYWFYSDPLCVTTTLLAAAEGVYVPAEESEIRVQGAKDFNFEVQRAFLTVFEKGLADSLQEDGRCGPKGTWQVAVTRDLTPSGGCPALGITLPTKEYELVRIEGDGAGNTLLFLGQSEDRTGTVKKRPTYFQPAMIQCSTAEFPLTHFLNSYNSTAEIPRLRAAILLVMCYSFVRFVL